MFFYQQLENIIILLKILIDKLSCLVQIKIIDRKMTRRRKNKKVKKIKNRGSLTRGKLINGH